MGEHEDSAGGDHEAHPYNTMRCPICRKEVPWAGNLFRPFCSERCKLIDLDNWLSGRYCISTSVESQGTNRPAGEVEQDDKRRSG